MAPHFRLNPPINEQMGVPLDERRFYACNRSTCSTRMKSSKDRVLALAYEGISRGTAGNGLGCGHGKIVACPGAPEMSLKRPIRIVLPKGATEVPLSVPLQYWFTT